MDDQQFDKRMALLKKSYDRMELQLNPDNVFKQIEEEKEEEALPKQSNTTQQKHALKWQKPAVWIASVASVLLVGLLVSFYTLNQQENTHSKQTQDLPNEKAVEEEIADYLTKKFNSKKEDIRKELKVTKDELEAFDFIKNANSMLDFYLTTNLHLKLTDENYVENMEENIMNRLITPKRSLEKIKTFRNLSFEESFAVYSNYVISVEELERFYSKLLEPYQQQLKEKDDVKQYPSDLQAIIEAANNQYMELKTDGNGVFYFKANPIDGEFAPQYINQLHPDVFGYFEYLKMGYLLLADDLRYTREETARSLKIMERTLLADVNADSTDYKLLQETYKNTWVVLLLGTKQYPAIANDGQPNRDYMKFLEEVASGKYGEVMQKTAATILGELQQTQHSATLSQLTPYDIWTILLQTRQETAGTINDSDFNVVDMNESRIAQIKGIYEQYKNNNDEAIINQLHPINIASLYLYAVTIDDKEMQNALLTPDAEVDANMLQTIQSLDVFSQLGEYNGIIPTVAARVAIGSQEKYGRQFLIKFSKSEEGYYRITAIMD